MKGFLIRLSVNVLALLLVSSFLPGIEVHGLVSAIAAALLLGIFNAFLRPILVLLTLPITLVTFGLFLLVLNGLLLKLVAFFIKGFEVHGFWPAVFGAFLISVISWLLNVFVNERGRVEVIVIKR